MYERLNLG